VKSDKSRSAAFRGEGRRGVRQMFAAEPKWRGQDVSQDGSRINNWTWYEGPDNFETMKRLQRK
jgi:hypothetical protein